MKLLPLHHWASRVDCERSLSVRLSASPTEQSARAFETDKDTPSCRTRAGSCIVCIFQEGAAEPVSPRGQRHVSAGPEPPLTATSRVKRAAAGHGTPCRRGGQAGTRRPFSCDGDARRPPAPRGDAIGPARAAYVSEDAMFAEA